MGVVLGLVLIVLGLLAASSVIAAKSADAGRLIETLRPVQGWFGVVGTIAGVLFFVLNLFGFGGKYTSVGFTQVVLQFGAPLLLAAVGFLMGFSMLMSMLADHADARRRADDLYERLSLFQVPLGLAAVAVGVWAIIA